MLENLVQLVKDHAGDAILNNPVIPAGKKDAAINATATGIMDQLKKTASSGSLDQITGLFKSGNTSGNPLVSSISTTVISSLVSKIGISQDQAAGVVKNLIPTVMNSFIKKTNDPNDKSFDLQSIAGALSGGGVSGILNKVTNMFG